MQSDMKDIFGILGAAFLTASAIPYIAALWKRQAKPHAFSWTLWSLINAIVCAAQVHSGAGAGAWSTATTAIVNGGIAIYAFRNGEKNVTRSDWAFFLSALAALPLWIATKDPMWSVILVCVIDTFGFFPTVRKSWHRPYEEVLMTFVLGEIGFFFSILALENYSLTNWLYPGVVLATNSAFIVTLLYRRRISRGTVA
jgi:hypothetical protein